MRRLGFLVTAAMVAVALVGADQVAIPERATSAPLAGTNPITYVHDDAGRLTAAVDPGNGVVKYGYDAAGNMTSIARPGATKVSVLEFYPKQGPVGTSVTIYGTAFSSTPSQDTVKFHGTTATVTSATPTQLVATVPAGATTGTISVTAPGGAGTSSASFTVASPAVPSITGLSASIAAVDTPITITGSNFQTSPSSDNAALNLTRTTVSAATATSITTTVPPGATSGKLTVVTPAGQAVSSADLYVPPPGFTTSQIETTGRLAFGTPSTGYLATNGDADLFLFDGHRGQRVSMHIQNDFNKYVDVYIQDPFGVQVAKQHVTFNVTGFLDTHTLTDTGTYTVKVTREDNGAGSVSLTLYDVPPDPTGTIQINGPSVPITTTTQGQNASVSFTGTTGQVITLSWNSPWSGCFAYNMTILKPNGDTLASGDFCLPNDSFDPKTLDATGTYTIVINPYDERKGTITLTLTAPQAGPRRHPSSLARVGESLTTGEQSSAASGRGGFEPDAPDRTSMQQR
jgi:YD repeat-containing protein